MQELCGVDFEENKHWHCMVDFETSVTSCPRSNDLALPDAWRDASRDSVQLREPSVWATFVSCLRFSWLPPLHLSMNKKVSIEIILRSSSSLMVVAECALGPPLTSRKTGMTKVYAFPRAHTRSPSFEHFTEQTHQGIKERHGIFWCHHNTSE